MASTVCLNGQFHPANIPVLMADNRSYRYGDGLFETMLVKEGIIVLEKLHFTRLFDGLGQLGYHIPPDFQARDLRETILTLCGKNNCRNLARVRLSVFRGNGGINDPVGPAEYLVEAWPFDPAFHLLNDKGWLIDVYDGARKSCDIFSRLKSASHLPYIMAAAYAKTGGLNDCLLLNMHDRIADSTIANLFIVRDGRVVTTPIGEGCVAGVMRAHLCSNTNVDERPLTTEEVLAADEIFLTNAIMGIRWVHQFKDRVFGNAKAKELHQALRTSIWGY